MTLPHRIVERGPAILHGEKGRGGKEVTRVDIRRAYGGTKALENP